MRTIYVAGGSDERHEAQDAISVLEAKGFRVTFNWTKDTGYPENGGKPRGILSALDDIRGVEDAQYFWIRLPKNKSEGAFFDFGIAVAMRRHQGMLDSELRGKRCVIVSGYTGETINGRSIFSEIADLKYQSHDMALMWLLGVAP